MKQIEFERWELDAENPCKLKYAGQRKAEDVFHELEARLDSVGYLPDEYLLLDRRWQNGREMPRDAGFFCRTDYGGSEGIYLDMFLEWYEDSQRRTEHFMTGKTLGESGADMMTFFKQSEGVPMQTINLKQYYPFCKEDIFVEVSDEIVEAFLLDKRAEAARDRKMFRYKAFYSLDCNDGIENAAIGWAQPSPEDYLIEKEELAEYEELIRRLYEAISSLPPMQARRVHARYMLGMKVKDIAAMEGITPSQAGKSIHAALRRLRRYFARQKWTVNL